MDDDRHDNSNYQANQIEDNEFLNKLDTERSYAGSQKPMVEKKVYQPTIQELQANQWYRDGDRDPRIDMEREDLKEED